MIAAVIDEYGGADRLQVREVDRPEPGPGELRIRVRAAGVNPVDWKIRRGDLRLILRSKLPMILGGDVAGEVDAVGPGVSRFGPGDPVVALLDLARGGGGYAEFAVCPESAAARRPEAWSVEEAASVPIAGLTALQSLRDLGRLPEGGGGSVLVNGASGGVGTFAIQIAKAMGARVVGTCSASNEGLVRGLGADEVIDYRLEDFTRRDDRFDVVLDASARSSFGRSSRVLKPGGAYVSTLPSPGLFAWKGALPVLRLLGNRKRAHFVLVSALGEDLAFLGRLGDEGRLRPVIDRVFPLEEVRQAHERSETGHPAGKVVLRIP
jgi:NADPH:quinone reductase-like Zn-dependent oxidoreductase